MWILESNGDFLQGKRMWLKPGKKYLFGRAKEARLAINHKTVSRKHFILAVDPVRDEDVGRVHARTKITITDISNKSGTSVNGEPLNNTSKELDNPVISIRLGTCPHELVIRWVPCVLTFGLTKKEIKNGLLKTKQSQVRELDVKAVNDYLTGQTTHLIVQKRNTAKGLQALIEGNPIVTDSYVDALIYASAPTNIQEEESLCPLEIDFDEAWPDPAAYLPPPGKEPTTKPDEAYRPDSARAKVFDKYTFFFVDQSQYDSLLPPITTGHGKALILKTTDQTTTVDHSVAFIRKAIGTSRTSIIVKPNESEDTKSWIGKHVEAICARLGQEPASQSDFLDSILAIDASQLQKSQSQESTGTNEETVRADKSQQDHGSSGLGQSSGKASAELPSVPHESTRSSLSSLPPSRSASAAPEPHSVTEATRKSSIQDDNPRPRKRTRVAPPRRAVGGFDDDFNPNDIAAYEEEPLPAQRNSRNQTKAQAQAEESDASIKEEPNRQTKNQSPSEVDEVASDQEFDDLLPAAAAMRKERQAMEAEARRKGLPVKSSISQSAKISARPKKEVKLLDVREAVRAQREAEAEADKQRQQKLDDWQAEEEVIKGPANVVQIKDFDLPVRKKLSEVQNGYRGETWKPEWDGRKNFKGFRRARDHANGTDGPRRTRDKIIVPLVAVKKSSYGMGDQYWSRTDEDRSEAAREKERKSKTSQKSSHDQKRSTNQSQRSQTIEVESASESEHSEQSESIQISPETARLQQEAEEVLDHPIDVDAPRQTRHGDSQTQTSKASSGTTKSTRGSKRPASSTPTNRSTATKKQKTIPFAPENESVDEDDDSDDMKFKFGRGRRARTAR